jgi:hypothetical protein
MKNSSLIKAQLGWMIRAHGRKWYSYDSRWGGVNTNPFWFCTKNFGLVFAFWISEAGHSVILKSDREVVFRSRIHHIIFPGLILFHILRVSLFQPWEFDNNKISFSNCSVSLFQHFRRSSTLRYLFILFVILSSFYGGMDFLARVSKFKGKYYGN